jgi:hypothetical protein
MDRVLVRLLKRKTSIELDASSFVQTEFTQSDGSLDLSLSVYQLDALSDEPLVCICAEHTAGNELNPQARACGNLAETSDWTLVESPTQNKLFNFKFSTEAHHEMKFTDEDALKQFANQLVLWLREKNEDVIKSQNISKKRVTGYAYQKYLAEDFEWRKVCELSDKVKKWVMKGENIPWSKEF